MTPDGSITAQTFMIAAAVPEPASVLLMILGLGGVAVATTTARRKA